MSYFFRRYIWDNETLTVQTEPLRDSQAEPQVYGYVRSEDPTTFVIQRFYIPKDMRGNGLASHALSELMRRMSQQGICRFEVTIHADVAPDQQQLHDFFLHKGFQYQYHNPSGYPVLALDMRRL